MTYIRILLNLPQQLQQLGKVIGHINISQWTDLKLPTHRPVCPFCQQTLGKKWQNWGPHLYSLVIKINYVKYVINYFINTLLLQHVGNILLELTHVLGSFVTIMNTCKWMLSVESLKIFNHTKDMHYQILKLFFLTFHHFRSTLWSWLHKISTRTRNLSPWLENNHTLNCCSGNFQT